MVAIIIIMIISLLLSLLLLLCCGCATGVRLISSERLATTQREWATEDGVDSLFANGKKTLFGLGYHLFPFSSTDGDMPSDEASEGAAESEVSVADADAKIDAGGSASPTSVDGILAAKGTTSLGAFGHSGIGGSVAFCDPRHGLAVAVTVNHLVSNRVVAKRVIGCITAALNMGGTYDDFN